MFPDDMIAALVVLVLVPETVLWLAHQFSGGS
jgi:hypothetical protein